MDYVEYVHAFDEVERDYECAVEGFGLAFEASESSPRSLRPQVAKACGCACENGEASLWLNWISPACLACRTGEQTATFFVDLRCTRHCYFCFNPNQDHYEYFLSHERDIVSELEQAHASGARFRCLAVTGGEPLLHKRKVLAFLERAQQLYPGVHTRLYTSGDLLDGKTLRQLAQSGLTEIRFSVKSPDAGGGQEEAHALIAQAVRVIPDVVVEVPVIPGSLSEMKELLERCDAVGVRGVNLLEFCFPLHNAAEFRKRGFALRKRPYSHLYDYWYGGGVPVARSEREALELVEYAADRNMRVGVHYCSSDNKNTGQIFQQNRAYFADGSLRARYPWMTKDDRTRFLACAKAFGEDALAVREWLEAARGDASSASGLAPFGFDPDVPVVAFPLAGAAKVQEAFPHVVIAESLNVVEQGDAGLRMREVSVRRMG